MIDLNFYERVKMEESLQPNSLHCFVCGLQNPFGLKLKFYQTGPKEVTTNCVLGEEYEGYPGVVHGGIVASMLDELAGRAYMGIDPPRFMYTARLSIRYRKHVPTGETLRLVGEGIKTKGHTATAKSFIYGPNDELLAEAEALLIDVPEEVLKSLDAEALGWKIYPDEG